MTLYSKLNIVGAILILLAAIVTIDHQVLKVVQIPVLTLK